MDSFKLRLVEIVSVTSTYLFFLSPIKLMYEVMFTKDVNSVPFALFFFTNLNCICWSVYGIQIKSTPLWLTNIPGALLFLTFILIGICYSNIGSNEKITYSLALLALSILQFYLQYTYLKPTINGLISNLANDIMNLSPLIQVYQSYIYKSNIFNDIWIVIGLLFCNFFWGYYGILINYDWNILIPSIIAIIVGLMQVLCWAYYNKEIPNYHPVQSKDETDKMEQEI